MEQEGMERTGLGVARPFCQTGFNGFQGVIKTPLALEPGSQAETRVDRIGLRRNGALEAAARTVGAAEAMILLAEQHEQGRVVGCELLGALKSLIGEGEIQIVGGGNAQLKPQLHHPGKTPRQLMIAGQSLALPAAQQLLFGFLSPSGIGSLEPQAPNL
jgi:hypothetical protein